MVSGWTSMCETAWNEANAVIKIFTQFGCLQQIRSVYIVCISKNLHSSLWHLCDIRSPVACKTLKRPAPWHKDCKRPSKSHALPWRGTKGLKRIQLLIVESWSFLSWFSVEIWMPKMINSAYLTKFWKIPPCRIHSCQESMEMYHQLIPRCSKQVETSKTKFKVQKGMDSDS